MMTDSRAELLNEINELAAIQTIDQNDPDIAFLSSLTDVERKFVLKRIEEPSLNQAEMARVIGCTETFASILWRKPTLCDYIAGRLRAISNTILEQEAQISARIISRIDSELLRKFEDEELDIIGLLTGDHSLTPDSRPFSAEEVKLIIKNRKEGLSMVELARMRDMMLDSISDVVNDESSQDLNAVGEIVNTISKNYMKYGKKVTAIDVSVFSPTKSGGFEGATTMIALRRKEGKESDDDYSDDVVIDSSFEEEKQKENEDE